ncbi:MAG: glycosyltransferase family 9 protein, partial [Thermodesulfovibrionales bacterium]
MNFSCPPNSPAMPADRFLKILIIKPSSLGDIIHSLPLLNRLRKSFGNSSIHWVIDKSFREILEGHPMIDRLWVINKDEWKSINKFGVTLKNLKKLFKDLRAEMYDLVIDLQGLFRSGIIAKATGSGFRVGFDEAREGATLFYTHTVKAGSELHAVERYLMIADFLGLTNSEVSFPFPPLPEVEIEGVGDFLKRDYAVIAPGARWLTKRWLPERFGKVASMLPLKAIVIGSRSDISI